MPTSSSFFSLFAAIPSLRTPMAASVDVDVSLLEALPAPAPALPPPPPPSFSFSSFFAAGLSSLSLSSPPSLRLPLVAPLSEPAPDFDSPPADEESPPLPSGKKTVVKFSDLNY